MLKKKRVVRKVKVIKRKCNLYIVEQKIQVIKYAKEQGNIKAAEHFNVNRSMIGHWVTASSKWNIETNEKSK